MSNYQEGMIAVFVCLTALNFSILGIAIYYISEVRKENKVERFKVNVLIESMIEIFESKYKFYDDEEERNGGTLPRRE